MCLLASCAASACYETPEFSPASLVDRPRILAVVADPPEVLPVGNTNLSVLVAGAEDVSAHWLLCSTFSSFASGTQYGENVGDRGCASAGTPIGEGLQLQLTAADLVQMFQSDEQVREALGSQLPDAIVDKVRQSVGVAFSVEADVLADGKRLRALKRVLVSLNTAPAHNPPPPAFSVDDHAVRQVASASFACVPDDPVALRVAPDQQVQLTPLYDGSDSGADEPWLEDYMVLDARGMLSRRREQAFYSWFVSKGSVDHGMTQAPERDNVWRAPATQGCATLWLVVRDGHGGESACGIPVSVGDVDNCALTTP